MIGRNVDLGYRVARLVSSSTSNEGESLEDEWHRYCVSVRLSQISVLPKWLNIGLQTMPHDSPGSLVF